MKKITVSGIGYVGLNLAFLLAQDNIVTAIDIYEEKLDYRKSILFTNTILKDFVEEKSLSITTTLDSCVAYQDVDIVFITTPTDYNYELNALDTSSIINVIDNVNKYNSNPIIVIKSTLPIGFMDYINNTYTNLRFIYAPEFLREDSAISDLMNPDRIVIGLGKDNKDALFNEYKKIIRNFVDVKEDNIYCMDYKEAEAVKLFSNSYLAMRISFFNELDSFAFENKLDTSKIIQGICSDKRIGNLYNNPSFGFGGYCLPKDTKQLNSDFKAISHPLISSILNSNESRKDFIIKKIQEINPKSIGIYRLNSKKNGISYRYSANLDILKKLKGRGVHITIYEPLIKTIDFLGIDIENNLERFKTKCDLILANRVTNEIKDVEFKIFTREIY